MFTKQASWIIKFTISVLCSLIFVFKPLLVPIVKSLEKRNLYGRKETFALYSSGENSRISLDFYFSIVFFVDSTLNNFIPIRNISDAELFLFFKR